MGIDHKVQVSGKYRMFYFTTRVANMYTGIIYKSRSISLQESLLASSSAPPVEAQISYSMCSALRTYVMILRMSRVSYKLMLCRQHDRVTGEHQECGSVEHHPVSFVSSNFAFIYNREIPSSIASNINKSAYRCLGCMKQCLNISQAN